ncbi:MAG: methyltransferase domain-containing protein [Planctomycetes bacterium]|nr:methyltransferase domain-containing protein [Planctomycetota bacterium]
MTTEAKPTAVDSARDYYNSDDADNFYYEIWGGSDIHIGLYDSKEDDIRVASEKTVERIASKIEGVTGDSRVIDLGSGYGGAARFLARKFGCHVTALNLSAVQNDRHRELNGELGLEEKIDVACGSFEEVPAEDASFDVVWSQDAILHSGNREKVIAEVARVLKPGGEFIFTDPMQSDDCPDGVLDPILDRIHLATLGSPGFYRNECAKRGLELISFEDLTHQLVNHYSAVLRDTERNEKSLSCKISADYIERMKEGLRRWIEGGEKGWLSWGIFHFRKPG